MENFFDNDLITLSEVKMWDTSALKEFCRKRGYKVSGSREELCARVYVLYNNQVAEEPEAKQQEASRRSDYKTIYGTGPVTGDPMRLKKWLTEKEGLAQWPPVSYVEIVKFISRKGHSLSADALTSYKTGKGFAYFYNDWLQEVFYHPVNKDCDACYLKAECTPSNRLSDEPHSLWVKANKKGGEIYSAYCTCVAG